MPPLSAAREQLKYFFRWSWFGLGSGLALVVPLVFLKSHVDPKDGLLLAAGYAFYSDIARICKLSPEDAERKIRFLYNTMAFLFAGIVFAFTQIWESRFSSRDAWFSAVFLPVLVIILVVKWWAGGFTPGRQIQTLDLNEKAPGPNLETP
jgi:hypothetical protein